MTQIAYVHPGWVGTPYRSDFQAQWGLIERAAMFDGSGYGSISAAGRAAKAQGLEYLIAPQESRHGNRLYRTASPAPKCVYAILQTMEQQADDARKRYAAEPERRFIQRVRVLSKAGERSAAIEEALLERLRAGRCEATAIPFTDAPGSPCEPTVVRRDPTHPFSLENALVVASAYSRLHPHYGQDEVASFVRAFAENLNARSEHP
jgi:hypothetical protein